MTANVLFIQSDDGELPKALQNSISIGIVKVTRQIDLTDQDIVGASGLLTTIYLDQIDFAARKDSIRGFLENGGRIVFNGHVAIPFIDGLLPFVPMPFKRRSDLQLHRLSAHAVFEGINTIKLEEQKGVAGFYGRGHNPPLAGALNITGIGPDRLPVDWESLLPGSGGLFVHSGNDIWSVADDEDVNARMAERLVLWASNKP
jgi:hypothetical protein